MAATTAAAKKPRTKKDASANKSALSGGVMDKVVEEVEEPILKTEVLNAQPEEKPEEDTEKTIGRVIKRRRKMQGDTTNLSLRINSKDLSSVQFLAMKRQRSIQALLIEGINLLIEKELQGNTEDRKYLWEIQ